MRYLYFFFPYHIRYTSLEEQLSKLADLNQTSKFVETKSNLMKWIHEVESILLSEHAVITDVSVMEEQLKQFQVRLNDINPYIRFIRLF